MSKRLKRFFRIFVNTLSVLIFAIGIISFLVILASRDEGIPNLFGYSLMTVQTTSMEPEYREGSVVVIKSSDMDDLTVGDDICFYSTDPKIMNLPNTHRIYDICVDDEGEKYFITKGLANESPDNYLVYQRQLIGKVVLASETLGKAVNIITTQEFMFFALVVPLLAIIFIEVLNIRKIKEESNSGKDTEVDK